MTTSTDTLSLSDFRINATEFPYPKANNLTKALQALEAINAGANTTDAVREALGTASIREAKYHVSNLGYLGLIERVSTGRPVQYGLTVQGTAMLNASAGERALILSHLISQFPTLSKAKSPEGRRYADATVLRRSSVVASWKREIDAVPTGDSAFHLDAKASIRRRIAAARRIAKEQRSTVK